MKQFVAFVRGINVGGHGVVEMVKLRKAVSGCGFECVKTYIQSGNVLFESALSAKAIAKKLESDLSKTLGMDLRLVVIGQKELDAVLENVPDTWKKGNDLRRYIAFVRRPKTAKDLAAETVLRPGVDSIKIGKGVLYMTTKISGISKSGFSKLAGKKVYQDITIRNYSTVQKISGLMQSNRARNP